MIFIGNVFPTSLIRRKVTIRPIDSMQARRILNRERFVSYWGHENTLKIASRQAGVDLTPPVERPALSLTVDSLPTFNGDVAKKVLVLSPEYQPGFRPAIGQEVDASQIIGWQWLIVEF